MDIDIGRMVKGMQKKFNKYWIKSYVSLSIPMIFDPRYKFRFLEFLFRKAFASDAKKRKCEKYCEGCLLNTLPNSKIGMLTLQKKEVIMR